MSTETIKKCDNCGEIMPLYEGAVIDILEEIGNVNRVCPERDRIRLDLCNECYRPFAVTLKQTSALRKRNNS